jgi:naphthoate synthase
LVLPAIGVDDALLRVEARDLGTGRVQEVKVTATSGLSTEEVDRLVSDGERFKQTDADVASFDGGYGSAYLAKMVGQKFAREIFFLGRTYDAETMHRRGAVNIVADHARLEQVALEVAAEINGKSPTAQRMLKFAFNLTDDGLMGQQIFAGEATRLAYMTDEATEGRDSFLEKRAPDWSPFPWSY